MASLEQLIQSLPEYAKDMRLNMQAVLDGGTLSAEQTFGIAVATAIASGNRALQAALQQEAASKVPGDVWPGALDDARAAATLMGMNNVFYRFRHHVGKPSYSGMPAQLRMNRMGKLARGKVDFELTCLAVSAVHGCEMCVRSHEKAVLEGGLTELHVHHAVRIAATVHGTAVALAAASVP